MIDLTPNVELPIIVVCIVVFVLLFLILIFSKYATIKKTKTTGRDILTDKIKQNDRNETKDN